MNAPRFPLIRLPLASSQNVLRMLTANELFDISLASKKTKVLVQSLKIKASELIVYVGDRIFFSIRLWFLRRALFTRKVDEDIGYRSYSNRMNTRTFLDHVKLIFNVVKIKVDFWPGSRNFDFESVLEGRQDIESVTLKAGDQEENRRILNIMKPSKVYILPTVFRPRDLLVQNFDYLHADYMEICLNDLLSSNIRNFETTCPMIPAKVFNRFLKLWMRGSNSQLESLLLDYFSINEFILENEIFAGLKMIRSNTVRYLKLGSGGARRINGGFDIFRYDGTMASILVYSRVDFFKFEMIVWHDHCIADM